MRPRNHVQLLADLERRQLPATFDLLMLMFGTVRGAFHLGSNWQSLRELRASRAPSAA